MKRFWLVCVFFGFFLAGCSQLSTEKDVYHVVFDGYPDIYDAGVYYRGNDIGEIVKREGLAQGTKITVSIKNEYRDLMTDNTVFYEKYGKLNYSTISNFGKTLEPGTGILGFTSPMALYWFKTRTLLTQPALAAGRKANQLLSQSRVN